MSDWFTDLVAEVAAEVVASPETRAKLALTDRVTGESLVLAAVDWVDELRAQFATDVGAILRLTEAFVAPVRSIVPLLIWRQDRRWQDGSRKSWRQLFEGNWKPSRPIVLPLAAVAAILFGLVGAHHAPVPGYVAVAMSTPEIVGAFRSFTDLLGRREDPDAGRIPVVVGIDEVDKIADPRRFRRGASLLPVTEPGQDPDRQPPRRRPGAVADLLFVLSGGLPRELVRFIRRAVEAKESGETAGRDTCWIEDLAGALTIAEIQAQQKAVLARGRILEPCELRDTLLAWATERQPADSGAHAHNVQRYLADLLAQGAELARAHGLGAWPDRLAPGACRQLRG